MSGTSLDGLDIALCQFENDTEKQENKNDNSIWKYKIIKTEFIEYSKYWKQNLQNAHLLSAFELKELETEWTKHVVNSVNRFVLQSEEFDFSSLDCLSSHGHTVLHQPLVNGKNERKNQVSEEFGFTLQLGNGAMLAAQTGFKTICDFRQTDVALYGQGAPLVPIGDELLFADYDFCLNLGGIANISFNKNKYNKDKKPNEIINSRFAFDICICNIILNYLSAKLGFEYDEGGKLAKEGKIDQKLFQKLNKLEFYKKDYPKSLGREWVEEYIFPLLELEKMDEQNIKNLLHTFTYHSAFQIAESIKKIELDLVESLVESKAKKNMLVTGGGAHNDLLIKYLTKFLPQLEVEKGSKTLIAYKEALIFAFLGILRLREETNTLASVTGATKNSCGGSIYLG